MLKIKNLTVSIKFKTILENISLDFQENNIHLLMGPNGSGKSSLMKVLVGDSNYSITTGDIFVKNTSINLLTPDQKFHKGIFLAFQNPTPLPGISVLNFLKATVQAKFANTKSDLFKTRNFYKLLDENIQFLGLEEHYLYKELHGEFSGGERKKLEILQMLMLQPKIILLDEIDSGLDVDSVRIIAKAVNLMRAKGSLILLITHYKNILDYIDKPSTVSVMYKGCIIKTGNFNLCDEINKKGYGWLINN